MVWRAIWGLWAIFMLMAVARNAQAYVAAHDAQQASGPEAQQRADVLRAQLQQYCILSSDDAFRCGPLADFLSLHACPHVGVLCPLYAHHPQVTCCLCRDHRTRAHASDCRMYL
jgi:hypothetical protein